MFEFWPNYRKLIVSKSGNSFKTYLNMWSSSEGMDNRITDILGNQALPTFVDGLCLSLATFAEGPVQEICLHPAWTYLLQKK